MVSGYWNNQDGLPLQFGTTKAVPEVGGDWLAYGETREFEQYIPLVPWQLTTAGLPVPAPAQTTFSGTTNAAAAGIVSLTNLFPLQTTAPVITTTSIGGVATLLQSAPQLFIESVEVETLVVATGGTSISVGLAFLNGATQQFTQITPNPGVQLINGLLTASMAVAGMRTTFTQPGSTGLWWGGAAGINAAVPGGGTWIGNAPLVTNAVTPLPNNAYISTVQTGTYTNGLIKLRVRYNWYSNINQ
jgi:hypothetical protein